MLITQTAMSQSWTNLGSGLNLNAYALAVSTNGELYAGGVFTNAGGVSANYIAKWDGSAWTNLGSGVGSLWGYYSVEALAISTNGELYAGGWFTNVGNIAANRIAKWDGSSWTNLGSGIMNNYVGDYRVSALAFGTNGELYAGGFFTNAGGVSADHIAKWDGSAWTNLGSGLSAYVYALALGTNGVLYAGGYFTNAGGVGANYVAKWDGSSWTNLGSGLDGVAYALTVGTNGVLYAGGSFSNAGGVSAANIAKWDGSAWTNLGSGLTNVGDIAYARPLVFDTHGDLYVGSKSGEIFKWDGSTWTSLGWVNNAPLALAMGINDELYVGGGFTTAGGVSANYVAKWTYMAMNVIGTNRAVIVNGEPAAVDKGTDFGVQLLGVSLTNEFSITNNGSESLQITDVTTSGNGAAWFKVSGVPDIVSPGCASNFTVKFNPLVIGLHTAVVSIVNNSPNTPYRVNFRGMSGGEIGLNTSSLVFVGTYGGTNPAESTFTITNLNQADFNFTNTVSYGSGTPGWLSILPSDGSVAGGGAQVVTGSVNIGSLNAGVYKATNAVTSTNALNSPQNVVMTLTVNIANQTITNFTPTNGSSFATTNTVGLAAQASSGLAVTNFAVISGPGKLDTTLTNLTFTNSGSVSVTANQAGNTNWNLAPTMTNTFNVGMATAVVTLTNLNQTYNGTPRVVGATTVPSGLSVTITYNGSGTAPTAAGNYAVIGVVNDIMYQGSQTGTLVVSNANQTINFPAIPTQRTNNLVGLSATASSGLTVSFRVGSGPGTITASTNLSFTGVGNVNIVASQGGDSNYNPAPDVINVVKVYALSVSNGPYAGGNSITITNGTLGAGGDITNLLVGGRAATIQTQSVNWVKITLPSATSTGAKDIIIQSTTVGLTVFSNAYTYNPTGNIFTVSPTSGSYTGGYPVVIAGTNLCNGSDITNVTLCGSNVASITSQNATQVVVTAGAGTGGIGDVAVYSISYGVTIKSSAFWYSVPPQNISATDGTYTNMIRVTWSASPGATGYEVWRNLINSTVTARQIGNTESLIYDDTTTASGVTNYYWVKATNSYGISSFSSSDFGWRQPPAPGEVAFSAVSYTVKEDAGSVTLTVTRSRGSDGAASVNYSTQNGTATAGVDYVAISGTLSWADGDSAGKTMTVTIINRSGKQDDRVFTIGLSGACNVTIGSPSSSSVTIKDMWPPSPSGIKASKGTYSDKVLVSWNYVPALFSASYKVWRGTDSNAQNASLIGTCTTAFYLDTSTVPDIPYYYWIQAFNTAGTSDLSVPDSGYCGSIANLPSPTGIQISEGTYTDRIRVAWLTVNNATSYEVWRNTKDDRSTASRISEPTGTNYNDTSVAQGIYYYYWLKARTTHRDGNFSNSDSGWCRLNTPAGVSASNGSYSYHIRVVWNAVANAAWYEVWREEVPGSNSDGGNLTKVAQTGDVYFNDYQAKSGVYYRYNVKAFNGICSSLDYGHDTGIRQVATASTSLPVLNDYDGDKLSDLALFNSSSGVLDVLCSTLGQQTFILGAERSQGVTGDYDGDRIADPIAYYPDSGTWLARLSSSGYNPIIWVSFGGDGNNPVAGDFDGDDLADMGVYNETDGVLSAILSHGGAFDMRASCLIGGPGWRFISADFDGDGLADPTVYSESEGQVIILFSGNGYFSVSVTFGGQGKAMYAADFDGDGLADPVLHEQATGIWTVLLSSAGYRAAKISFGGLGYVPVIGDFDGDGLADPAVYQETTGQWLIMFSASSYSVIEETFGGPECQPIVR